MNDLMTKDEGESVEVGHIIPPYPQLGYFEHHSILRLHSN